MAWEIQQGGRCTLEEGFRIKITLESPRTTKISTITHGTGLWKHIRGLELLEQIQVTSGLYSR